MKKLLVAGLLGLSTSFAQAQNAHFGLKAGINASNIIIKDQGETEFKIGVHGGGLAHIHLVDEFAVQPELMVSTQGGKQFLNNVEINTNLTYLSVPVLLQYMFSNGFRLQAGPQISVLLTANRDFNGTESNIIQNIKTTDFGIPVGVSYLHASGLGIDARWVFGLTNINDVGNRQPVNRNSMGQFGVFYLLNYEAHRHK